MSIDCLCGPDGEPAAVLLEEPLVPGMWRVLICSPLRLLGETYSNKEAARLAAERAVSKTADRGLE